MASSWEVEAKNWPEISDLEVLLIEDALKTAGFKKLSRTQQWYRKTWEYSYTVEQLSKAWRVRTKYVGGSIQGHCRYIPTKDLIWWLENTSAFKVQSANNQSAENSNV